MGRNVMSDLPHQVLHLSSVLRSPLLDRAGERLGRVEDLIVRLADGGYPPVTGLKARIGGRELFVPVDRIASLAPGAVRLSGEKLSLRKFERRPGEVLLAGDVLGRKLVDVEADPPRLVTAHEIELTCIDGWWRVVGLDHSPRAQIRRLLPRRLRGIVGDRPFLDWADMEPFVGHVPTSRLRFSHRKLANLHPAEIADLVEAASHDEGEELIEAVVARSRARGRRLRGARRAPSARVHPRAPGHARWRRWSRAWPPTTRPIWSMRSTRTAARASWRCCRRAQRLQIEALLGYNPSTAGGLMSPDFISLAPTDTVEDALAKVRDEQARARARLRPSTCWMTRAACAGSVFVVSLLRAEARQPLEEIAEASRSRWERTPTCPRSRG